MEEKIIVYVEKEKFLRDMMEKAITSAGMRIYTYPDRDCLHFINDLAPKVLVLDAGTVDDEFLAQIPTQIPVILLGADVELESISRPVRERIEKPFGPFDLVSKISQLLSH